MPSCSVFWRCNAPQFCTADPPHVYPLRPNFPEDQCTVSYFLKQTTQKWVCNREPDIELRYRDRETRKERTKENGRKNDVQIMTLMSEVVFEGSDLQ